MLLWSILLFGCNTQANVIPESSAEANKTKNPISCPAMESRNWQAWIDGVAENEPQLNISGEIDLPTPGYQVEWQPGILDRSNPPTQRISIILTPPEGIVIQVVTPSEVSFTMGSPVLEYRSVEIYCDDRLLVDISDVKAR